jgi:hypothetical protein
MVHTEESTTITLSEDTTLEAIFELIPVYTLTVTSTEGGSISSEGGRLPRRNRGNNNCNSR